jgi:hypothetical protein
MKVRPTYWLRMTTKISPASDTVSDNPVVIREATQAAALPLHEVALIGIVGPTTTPTALLRLKTGNILKLAVGDDSPVGPVIGIDQTSLRLKRGGRVRTLRLLPD